MGLPKARDVRMEENKSLPAFLKPLRIISPSAFSAMQECALKEVWRQNGKPPLLPTSPKARVGTVAHKLLAEAGRGHLEATAEAVNTRWHELLEEAGASISRSPLECHLSPLDLSVPDIEVLRIRATRKAIDIASESESIPKQNRIPAALRSQGHEIPVRSSDDLVRGTIDVATREDGTGVIIQDYKSGSIVEPDDSNGIQLKEAYQTQLKMYAGLYADTFGEWPASLELVSLTGETQSVYFTKNDCSNLIDEAKTTLHRVNEQIGNHSSESLPSILANPTPQACAFCHYRPACGPYRFAAAKSDNDRWPLDVIGTVESIKQLGNSKIMLELRAGASCVKIPGLSPAKRHPALSYLQQGDIAGAFSLRRLRPTSPYSESQLTTVHKLVEVHEDW